MLNVSATQILKHHVQFFLTFQTCCKSLYHKFSIGLLKSHSRKITKIDKNRLLWMDYVHCTFLNANSWLPLNGKKKKRTKYFQQYVQDAIMIQAENNKIGLTEFSNNKIFIIFHVFIQWWKFHFYLHLHCMCKTYLLTKQEHFRNNR